MSRSLIISQRQAQTLIRAADAEKAIVEVKLGDLVYRLIPKSRADQETVSVDGTVSADSFDSLDDYYRWRDRQRAGQN